MANGNPQTVTTGKVRLSYVHIFAPYTAQNSDKAKYSCAILIDKKDTKTLGAIRAAVDAAIQTGKSSKWGGKIPANLKKPLRDGDAERPGEEEYAGKYFLNCSSDRKPGIVDSHLQEILDPTEVYSGCYGRVNVTFFPFDASGNRGVAVGLNHVMKVADGEPLGGAAPSVEAAFGDVEEEDNFDDLLNG